VSTFGPTSVGTNYSGTPAVTQTRGVGLGQVSSVGNGSGDLPAFASQTPVPTGPGVTTAIDEITQEAALVDGAISMPARPLAEIIWQLRASVNAGRGSVRASRSQTAARDATSAAPPDGNPKPAPQHPSPEEIRGAARAYNAVQMLGSGRTTGRSVDIYTGKK